MAKVIFTAWKTKSQLLEVRNEFYPPSAYAGPDLRSHGCAVVCYICMDRINVMSSCGCSLLTMSEIKGRSLETTRQCTAPCWSYSVVDRCHSPWWCAEEFHLLNSCYIFRSFLSVSVEPIWFSSLHWFERGKNPLWIPWGRYLDFKLPISQSTSHFQTNTSLAS